MAYFLSFSTSSISHNPSGSLSMAYLSPSKVLYSGLSFVCAKGLEFIQNNFRFAFIINSPILGFNSLLSMFALPVSVWWSPALWKRGKKERSWTVLFFCHLSMSLIQTSLHADSTLTLVLPTVLTIFFFLSIFHSFRITSF